MKKSNQLCEHSIRIIRTNQAESGAYIACPNFPVYRYSWFRDGAFIAYAMDLVGQHDSARRFHDWAARTILRHAEKAWRAIEQAARGEPLGEDFLHTRYTLDGNEGPPGWPNFQLDGLGTWLWALAEHNRRPPTAVRYPLPAHWQPVVDLIVRYLSALWRHPCYDLWEEHPESLHPYTLAAIYAGLRAADGMAVVGDHSSAVVEEIRRFVLEHGVQNGHLVKHIHLPRDGGAENQGGREGGDSLSSAPLPPSSSTQVDASLIGVATPYRLLAPDDPIMRATAARIERDLHCSGGGVHRYQTDTYYGGGEWLLLAAWLGWYYMEVGETGKAQALQHWVEAQADATGNLPEQVSHHLLAPDYYAEWEGRWGPVAKPLLWSHAMYLILRHNLATAGR